MAEAKRKLVTILSADVVGYSLLMADDEAATVETLKEYRAAVGRVIDQHSGRIVNAPGDNILAEFPSVVEGVQAAVEIQRNIEGRNAELPNNRRMRFRLGINLGDVIEEDDGTIYGDGVNIAARMEALADEGGICISNTVYESVEGKLDLGFDFMGEQLVKNIAKPVRVYRCRLAPIDTAPSPGAQDMHQDIRFCAAADGVQIAYAVAGQGPPLVKTGNWMTHLEYDWSSPIWGHLLRELASHHQLIRYDTRGNGLSDWDIEDISLEAFIADLETVVNAQGLDRFALFGVSQGCAVSAVYAARHPERVSHLVLYGGFAIGSRYRGDPDAVAQSEALATLVRANWGQDNPAYRQIFTSQFVPEGTSEQMNWFNELERISTSPENAARFIAAIGDFDVRDQLARVSAPTLVLHCRDDALVPFEQGRKLAAMIPGARFVALEGRNHLILEHEPAWPRFREEVGSFLAESDSTDA